MRMNWKTLLSAKRIGSYGRTVSASEDLRSEFEKDYHRIIGSASFRRLQDKTQVFYQDQAHAFPGSIIVCPLSGAEHRAVYPGQSHGPGLYARDQVRDM